MNIDPSITFPNIQYFHKLKRTILCHVLNLSDVTLKLSISVWDCVSYENLIEFIIKFIVETHLIIRFWFMWIHFVNFGVIWWNIIVYVESTLEPAWSVFQMTFERPKTWFHSVIKQRISFSKINNIYSDHIGCIWILHSEIKPLQVATSISVISHP